MKRKRSLTANAMPTPRLEWRKTARANLLAIVNYIADDNPNAAQRVKDEIEAKVEMLPERAKIYRPSRVPGTREMVVRSNYIVVYAENDDAITILRVLHAAQQWPPMIEPPEN